MEPFAIKDRGQQLQATRFTAMRRLEDHLRNPAERFLHPHQVELMRALYESLATGNTTGYVDHPAGAGKTVSAIEIIRALGMRTIFVSPTQTILEQTSARLSQFAPDIPHVNYYTAEKNRGGVVFNTTYRSLQQLVDDGEGFEDVKLIIVDELHTALGEKTHQLFRKLPPAIMIGLTATPYFDQLHGFERRGKIERDERWVGMFTNKIHEMTLEEGMERGVLTPLDVHLVRTSINVDNVTVTSGGQYNRGDLERSLNIASRNALAVGMIVGLGSIPRTIELTREQRDEITAIHEKIKGRKTAIFGMSIAQVEELAERLRSLGISADTLHGRKTKTEREQVLNDYSEGKTQVILGVDVLRLGWDSPPTEVGMYLAPTKSGIVAVQELGRILRTSPESGKEKAIAIQFVDAFRKRTQQPIIIPNLFDPYFILRGTQIGKEPSGKNGKGRGGIPLITFSGMNITMLLEESNARLMLQERFNQMDLPDLARTIDAMAIKLQHDFPGESILSYYLRLMDALPYFIPESKQLQALQAIASIDTLDVRNGMKALIYLNLKTIMSVAEHYFTGNEEVDSEIMQEGIAGVYERVKAFDGRYSSKIPAQIHGAAKDRIERFLREERLAGIGSDLPAPAERLSREDFDAKIATIAQKTGMRTREVIRYIEILREIYEQQHTDVSVVSKVMNTERDRALDELLNGLPPRQKAVIRARFGFTHGIPVTLDQAGTEIGVTRSRAAQIESEALMRLCHPTRARKIKDFKDDSVGGYINAFDRERRPIPIVTHPLSILKLPQHLQAALLAGGIDIVRKLAEMPYNKLKKILNDNPVDIAHVLDSLDNFYVHEDIVSRGEQLPHPMYRALRGTEEKLEDDDDIPRYTYYDFDYEDEVEEEV